MKTNEHLTATLNRSDTQVGSWPTMRLAQFLRLKKRHIAPVFASICVAVFAFALHSAHADLRPLSEPARDDADAFGAPPHSIAFHSNHDGNNEIYVMNPDGDAHFVGAADGARLPRLASEQ